MDGQNVPEEGDIADAEVGSSSSSSSSSRSTMNGVIGMYP